MALLIFRESMADSKAPIGRLALPGKAKRDAFRRADFLRFTNRGCGSRRLICREVLGIGAILECGGAGRAGWRRGCGSGSGCGGGRGGGGRGAGFLIGLLEALGCFGLGAAGVVIGGARFGVFVYGAGAI